MTAFTRYFLAATGAALALALLIAMPGDLAAAGGQGPGPGPGQGMGRRMGMGMGQMDESHMADMRMFHFLLDHGKDVRRSVTFLDNGIDTLTESDVPEVASTIKAHVASMYKRLEEQRPIHQRDPLFRELFKAADRISMTMTPTDKGIRVVETSTDPAVVKLLHEHARTVDLFIKNGRAEMHRNHPVP
ncbi:MAG: hypothetical protein AB1635_13575 [Acidobacteriota bacterium]